MRKLVVAALLGAALLPLNAMAASPFDGTWKEDIASAKMKQEPDVVVLKDGMFTCKSCVPSYTVKADGSDHAIPGDPTVDAVAVNASDENKVVLTEKKGGKTVETITYNIASDGKTMKVDFTGVAANGAPFSGSGGLKRVAQGPKGSEPVSGSWMRTGLTNASNSIETVTYKVDGDMLTMSDPTGDSYTAKMDGTAAPYKGNPRVTTVSVKKTGPSSFTETDKHDGKVVETFKIDVAADGNSMTVVDSGKVRHRTSTFTSNKV